MVGGAFMESKSHYLRMRMGRWNQILHSLMGRTRPRHMYTYIVLGKQNIMHKTPLVGYSYYHRVMVCVGAVVVTIAPTVFNENSYDTNKILGSTL